MPMPLGALVTLVGCDRHLKTVPMPTGHLGRKEALPEGFSTFSQRNRNGVILFNGT